MTSHTDTELEVAGILQELAGNIEKLQLRKRFYKSNHRHPCLLGIRWRTKKRRSAEVETRSLAIPLPPRTSPSLREQRADDERSRDKKVVVKVPECSTSSPATPFSFPPSSDDTEEKDKGKDEDSPTTAIARARPVKKPKLQHKELVKEKNQEIAQVCKRIENLEQEAAEARQQKEALKAIISSLREQKIKCEEEQARKQQEQYLQRSGSLLNLLPVGPTSSLPVHSLDGQHHTRPHQWRHPVSDAAPAFTVEPRRLPVDHRTASGAATVAAPAAKSYQYEQISWLSPQLWSLDSGHYRQIEPNTGTEKLLSQQFQQQILNDAKRAAMAEARKRRIQARKKSYRSAAGANPTANAAGIAVAVTSKPRRT